MKKADVVMFFFRCSDERPERQNARAMGQRRMEIPGENDGGQAMGAVSFIVALIGCSLI